MPYHGRSNSRGRGQGRGRRQARNTGLHRQQPTSDATDIGSALNTLVRTVESLFSGRIAHPTGVDTEAGEGNPAHTPVVLSADHGIIDPIVRVRLTDMATHPTRKLDARKLAARKVRRPEVATLHA